MPDLKHLRDLLAAASHCRLTGQASAVDAVREIVNSLPGLLDLIERHERANASLRDSAMAAIAAAEFWKGEAAMVRRATLNPPPGGDDE